jgi:hypothetical protein
MKSRWFEQLGSIWQSYSTLLVQHHGVVSSEILDLAFMVLWNQTLQLVVQEELKAVG